MKAKVSGRIWMKKSSDQLPKLVPIKHRTTITAKPLKSSTSSTNELTKAVIKFLDHNGHFCSRVQSQGQYHPVLKRWITSKVKRGIGDIIACIYGRFVMIEIKYGKDRQSVHQKSVQKQVTKCYGHYWLVKTFDDFIKYYNELQADHTYRYT